MSFLDELITNTIRADVRAMGSYTMPDPSGFIKLDAMENPYLLPEHLRSALAERLAQAVLNRYPLLSYATLKSKVCAALGVPEGYDVILGNGSDEIISMIAMATARQDRRATLLAPVPAFVMFERSASLAGMEFVGVPLQSDFSLDLPAMIDAIVRQRPAVVFLAYPNSPTGNLFAVSEVEAILNAVGKHGLVVIDEAYGPFAQRSFMHRLPECENMLVMRTVSKLGLAGIRLGYLSGAPALLAQIDKVRPPYNVNVLTQIAAEFALDHVDVLNGQAALLRAARTDLAAALAALPGVDVFPSAANFLLIRVPDVEHSCAKLLAERILVKNVSKMHALLANCIRVTVSTAQENAAFVDALKASLV